MLLARDGVSFLRTAGLCHGPEHIVRCPVHRLCVGVSATRRRHRTDHHTSRPFPWLRAGPVLEVVLVVQVPNTDWSLHGAMYVTGSACCTITRLQDRPHKLLFLVRTSLLLFQPCRHRLLHMHAMCLRS